MLRRKGKVRSLAATLATAALWAPHADAAECKVRLSPADAPGGWAEAVHALAEELRAAPRDCAALDVQHDPHGAAVALETRDGRRALRRVERPAELGPLVRALLVTVPDAAEEPPAIPAEAPPPPPPEPTSGGPAPASDATPAAPPRSGVHPFTSLSGGVRFPSSDAGGPLAQLAGGVTLDGWELGAFGRWEVEHRQSETPETDHTANDAIGGGALVGRRLALGPGVLALGGTLAVYAVEQELSRHHRDASAPTAHESFADPRAGAYAAFLVPTRAPVRTRIQLGGELAALEHVPANALLTPAPRWSLGLTIGLELGEGR